MDKYGTYHLGHGDSGGAAALERLESIVGLIEEIRNIFKTPSLSIGVNYKGEKIWAKGFGLANQKTGLVPNSETVYSIGSCTKGFTGTALCLLAERGLVDLDAPVSSKIPSLKTEANPVVAEKMTIRDMLSHCAGLSAMPFEVMGRHGHVFAKHEDIIQIFNHLPRAAEFKSECMYNNWLFALAGTLIAQETESSYGQFIQEEIFDRIGMKRTYTNAPPDDNHALPYLVFDHKEPKAVDLPRLNNGVAFDSSGAVRSCVDDLLLWSEALMQAWNQRASQDPDKSDLSVSLATAQTSPFPLTGDKKRQYALGLFNLHLQTLEMNLVTNPDVNSRDYSIGIRKDSGDRLAIGHSGGFGGFLSAYWTFPDDDCSLVVLANSFHIDGDPTKFIAPLLAQALFDIRPVVDFKKVTQDVVSKARDRWITIHKEWNAHRIPHTSPEPLAAYVGEYHNHGLAMSLSVTLTGDLSFPLQFCINGIEEQVFELSHYHKDSWTFLQPTRDECIEKGYSMYLLSWELWIIEFDLLEGGRFGQVKWRLDPDKRVDSQVFLRE